MTAPIFIDTNILIYSIDPTEPRKAAVAVAVLERDDLILSVQVFQEFVVQATNRRKSWAMSLDDAVAFVSTWRRFPMIETSADLFDRSLAICSRYKLNYWDSSIVAAAILGSAKILLTEDMQHGQVIDGVRIVNPFLDAA